MTTAIETARRVPVPKLSTIFWGGNHLIALTIIWLELEVLAAAYWWAAHTDRTWLLIAITLFVVKARQHLDDELTSNMQATYDRWFQFLWRTRTPEKWGSTDKDWPALAAPIQFGEFVGWWATLKLLAKTHGKAIPFTSATFTVRRPNNKGHTGTGNDTWLFEFAELLRRRFRYTETDTNSGDDLTDAVTLYQSKLPDIVIAVDR